MHNHFTFLGWGQMLLWVKMWPRYNSKNSLTFRTNCQIEASTKTHVEIPVEKIEATY